MKQPAAIYQIHETSTSMPSCSEPLRHDFKIPTSAMDSPAREIKLLQLIEIIQLRMEIRRRDAEIEYWRAFAFDPKSEQSFERTLRYRYDQLDADLHFICGLMNEQNLPETDAFARLRAIAQDYWLSDGKRYSMLSKDEIATLMAGPVVAPIPLYKVKIKTANDD